MLGVALGTSQSAAFNSATAGVPANVQSVLQISESTSNLASNLRVFASAELGTSQSSPQSRSTRTPQVAVRVEVRFVVCIAILVALVCCRAPVNAQEQADGPPYPPPGRLIDIGGWRLHLNCTGEARPGQPTVVLEAGKGDFSVEWSLVQPNLARSARVCSYDRAGDGWSDLGPHPRTMRQIVFELHTLLERAGEQSSVVLVGHSYGGWLVRLYQATYPAEVVAIVLTDAGANDPWRMMPDGRLVRSSELTRGQQVPAESG